MCYIKGYSNYPRLIFDHLLEESLNLQFLCSFLHKCYWCMFYIQRSQSVHAVLKHDLVTFYYRCQVSTPVLHILLVSNLGERKESSAPQSRRRWYFSTSRGRKSWYQLDFYTCKALSGLKWSFIRLESYDSRLSDNSPRNQTSR